MTALCALLATVGADADWLAALGRDIAQLLVDPGRRSVRGGVVGTAGTTCPFSASSSSTRSQAGLGSRGLVLAQVVAVVACLWLVSSDMRRAGVADAPAALVLILTAFAAAPALLVVRSQLFSLALFPLLVLLLRSEARRPSRRVWLLVPLVALWSNLHGGVLLGVAVAGAYLLFCARCAASRSSRCGVLAGMALALFADAGAARDGRLLPRRDRQPRPPRAARACGSRCRCTRPSTSSSSSSRSRCSCSRCARGRALWEVVAIAGLAVAAVRASRNEVWLALFVALPAATGARGLADVAVDRSAHARRGAVAGLLVARGGRRTRPDADVAPEHRPSCSRAAGRAAHGTPILADGVDAEQLALAGDRILIGNPLDAFPQHEQRRYLDWLAGRPVGDVEVSRVRVAIATLGSRADAARREPDFVEARPRSGALSCTCARMLTVGTHTRHESG